MRLRGRALLLAVALAAAGCATLAPPEVAPGGAAAFAPPFDIEGRMSARRGTEGGAAHFSWQHSTAGDDVELSTPLGQVLARLSGDLRGVRAQWPDGTVVEARDWDEMTQRALGVPIPVRGLASWLSGQSRGATAASVQRDAQGRAAVLSQDGWEIVYAYADDAALHPARLTLRYAQGDPTEVRLVIDRWQ